LTLHIDKWAVSLWKRGVTGCSVEGVVGALRIQSVTGCSVEGVVGALRIQISLALWLVIVNVVVCA
jgi:hypothetical protein